MALGTIVVAGILQIIFGILKLGRLSDFFPLPAIHGMLAAIGLIILSKQLHVLIGMNPVGENGKPLVEPFELIKAIPQSFSTIQERIPIVITVLVCISLVFLIPMSSALIL
jgi:MFS superfamily sulfate permease-like transporter